MSFGSLHSSAIDVLETWRPDDPSQESLRQSYLAYLAARTDAMERACAPGHLTASAVVVDAEGERTLLTLHPRIGRWVQLGGHCEPGDETLVDAALREAREESGIDELDIDPAPLQLDVHPLTCSGGVPTRHLDVRFLVRAAAGATERISDESLDLRWFGFAELPGELDESTRALIALAGEAAPQPAK
ncbi:NUDIX domain-containing protein [Epidermidibacterium keratini]|uniref:NUDIX domain-containing protein n=1 Tax=Epidermidibacterium keratini TaxID=1891644 RepID=A0A7L4YR01_9ACTN|nr:NUDIX hydrolase [Epidermidibacterium keratini]QHC01550.1 NUDIX domain-containing protein [Epidermidibacterium keratini]